jgi:leader peptidase (prepilin peptidase) / N-methyltransferase
MFDAEIWAKVPFHFWTLVLFMLGCMVGSFLNVCIYRMPLGRSVISPPSHCPKCSYSIPFYLNIPLVTWLMLRGRCANCREPISIRYFLVELLTGLMFAGCWIGYGQQTPAVALIYCIVVSGLIASTFIDLDHFIIPDEFTIGGVFAGLICSFVVPRLHEQSSHWKGLLWSIIGAAVGWVLVESVRQLGKLAFGRNNLALAGQTNVLFGDTGVVLPDREIAYDEIFSRKSDAIRFHAERLELPDRCFVNVDVALSPVKLRIGEQEFDPEQSLYMEATTDKMVLPREAMGFGDVKFMAAIGAFLGWQSTIFSLVVSSFIGAIVGGLMILLGRHARSSPIPYGPYIAAAAALWLFAGQELMEIFTRFVTGAP